jgi:hypothetical protein
MPLHACQRGRVRLASWADPSIDLVWRLVVVTDRPMFRAKLLTHLDGTGWYLPLAATEIEIRMLHPPPQPFPQVRT